MTCIEDVMTAYEKYKYYMVNTSTEFVLTCCIHLSK